MKPKFTGKYLAFKCYSYMNTNLLIQYSTVSKPNMLLGHQFHHKFHFLGYGIPQIFPD